MTRIVAVQGHPVAAEIAAVALSRLLPQLQFAVSATSDAEWPESARTTPLLRDFHASLGLSEASLLRATAAEPALELVVGDKARAFGEPGLGLYGERFWPVHTALAEAGRAGPPELYHLTAAARRAGRMAEAPADMRAMFDYGYVLPLDAYLAWLRGQGRLVTGAPALTVTVEAPVELAMPLDMVALQAMRIAGMLRAGRWDAELQRRQTEAELQAAGDLAALFDGERLTPTAEARLQAFRDHGRLPPGAPFPPALWLAALWPHAPYRIKVDLAAEAQSFKRMAILVDQSVATMPTLADWRTAVLARPE